ncbi:hypothetical protein SADUNF_Sadunf06G0100000 [Salix dunnii]|uniref:Heparan-alpha-glucosaminide N-acetyltransferase catalytic domain-containing protein n=1 Tax=Salix dunnii TaxID=1413687 RepID=A0A835K3I7_9ROSI|nr:hypothetical protein SADUNF_Sadunf06G0100000 [Salix dunnii]
MKVATESSAMEDPKRLEEGLGHSTALVPNIDDKNIHLSEKAGKADGGDDIHSEKEETAHDHLVAEHGGDRQPEVKQKSRRVATLDAFRGLTIVLMILVDDAGEAYPRIDHSPWNGCTLADFVMPFFLFIVGVAIALAFKRIPKRRDAVTKIIPRTLKLLFWGVLLQGGYSHAPGDLAYGVDMKLIRWCGILQRIALVYMVVALLEALIPKNSQSTEPDHFTIFTAYRWQWVAGFISFVIYMVTTFALYVPDWSFTVDQDLERRRYTVECRMRGHLGPACNAVGYVDREIWGINHLYRYPVWSRLKACTLSSPVSGPLRKDAPSWCLAPFEPEGLLSSISAILSGTIGIHYGHVLIHFKSHVERLKQWVSMGVILLIVAIILHFTDAIPINKQLYSFSYVCFTAGAAGIVFSGFYILIDVWGLRPPFLFLEWIGMNAMLVYVMAAQGIFEGFINGWYYKSSDNTLVYWIQEHVFNDVWHSERAGTLLYVIFAQITFWAVVSGVLHKLGIYWKL